MRICSEKYVLTERYLLSVQVVRISNSSTVSTIENSARSNSEIQEEEQQPKDEGRDKAFESNAGNKFERSKTMALVDEVLLGRKTEKSKLIELVGEPGSKEVISVWGMGVSENPLLSKARTEAQSLAAGSVLGLLHYALSTQSCLLESEQWTFLN